MITDKIRHTAWDTFTTCKSEFISDKLRAALEAVAPMLIAQGMRKSAYLYRDWLATMPGDGGTFDTYLNFQANELVWRSKGEFARAQEL